VRVKDRWLVDGGLVDPVPVGVARALEADVVIAGDLNSGVVSRKKPKRQTKLAARKTGVSLGDRSEMLKKMVTYNAETSFKKKRKQK
jgi:NTE family protein